MATERVKELLEVQQAALERALKSAKRLPHPARGSREADATPDTTAAIGSSKALRPRVALEDQPIPEWRSQTSEELKDRHPCSPVPHGHLLLLRRAALQTILKSMPPAIKAATWRELVLPSGGYKKGMVAPFIGTDVCSLLKAFVLVENRDLSNYRFACFETNWVNTTFHDLEWALQRYGWPRTPYVFCDLLCYPQGDSAYLQAQIPFYTEVCKLASEYHLFGTSSLQRCWGLAGVANAKRPIIHTASAFPEGSLLQHELESNVTAETYRGFSGAKLTCEDDREILAQLIVETHGSLASFDAKMRRQLSWQSDDGPRMRLLRVDALLKSSVLANVKKMHVDPEHDAKMDGTVRSIVSTGDTMGSLTSHQVRSTYWWGEAKSVDSLFPEGAFVELPWSEFRETHYAVLTYGWATITWSDIIAVLKKAKMQVAFVWIDIFCLDQNDPGTMKVINERTPPIYGGAKEYHVFGKHVASRGWCQCELGSARDPKLYSVAELPFDGLAHKIETHPSTDSKFQGFEKSNFYDEGDRDNVRKIIEAQNLSVANFDQEMRQFFTTFGNDEL